MCIQITFLKSLVMRLSLSHRLRHSDLSNSQLCDDRLNDSTEIGFIFKGPGFEWAAIQINFAASWNISCCLYMHNTPPPPPPTHTHTAYICTTIPPPPPPTHTHTYTPQNIITRTVFAKQWRHMSIVSSLYTAKSTVYSVVYSGHRQSRHQNMNMDQNAHLPCL